jgi:predicted MFS family arabinose efflux permease
MSSIPQDAIKKFSPYQKFVVAVLAFLQFTVVLDFMILSPLGAILMPTLNITPSQFGLVVSGYAFSAGASGLLAAGFADRFDRKKLLMFFYSGFILGTLFCGLAPSYEFLLAARIVTGLFGGVVGSISFAIITDLFPYDMRGRVMGIVQTSFAASQVMGLPFGLYLSNHWGWHAPFILIVIIGILAGVMIGLRLQPIRDHLKCSMTTTPLCIFSKP